DDIVETQPMGKIETPFEREIESIIDVQGMSMPIYDDVTLAGSDEAISIACNWYEELNRRAALEDSVETPLDTIPVKISTHEPSIVAQNVAFDKVDVLDPFDHHAAVVGIAFHSTLLDGCVELTGIDWEHSRQSIPFLFDDMSCPDPRTYLDVLVPAASPPAHTTKLVVVIEPLDVGSNMPSCRTSSSTSLDEMHATTYKSTLLDGHLVRPTLETFSVSIFDHTSACSNLQDALFPQPTSTCNVPIQQLLLPPSAHVHRPHDEIAFIESFKAFTRDILAVSHTPALQRISPSTLAIDMPTFWLTAASNFKDILFPDNEGAIVPRHCNAGGELQPTPHLIAPEEHSVEKSNKRHKPEEPAHRPRKRLRTRSTTIEHFTVNANTTSTGQAEDSSLSQSISHAARPLIWSLSSKKVLQIQETPSKSALQHLSIGSLRSKVQAKTSNE
ncbi:hypothetical protein AaE_002195, partial [Aphanomyces astaci]